MTAEQITSIDHNSEYVVCTGSRGIISGQGTADLKAYTRYMFFSQPSAVMPYQYILSYGRLCGLYVIKRLLQFFPVGDLIYDPPFPV